MTTFLSPSESGQECATVQSPQNELSNAAFTRLVETNFARHIAHFLPEILHEANNELAILQGSGELLSRVAAVPAAETLIRRGTSIVKASYRLAALCRLLERNPTGNLSPTSCELTSVMQTMRDEIMQINDFDHIGWRLEPSEPVTVDAPGWVVKQVILNLIANSIHALSFGGGAGEIVTQFTSSDTTATFHWRDSGNGFSETELGKLGSEIFPAQDSRLGVGLYVSAGLIERLNGSIEFLSGPGGMVSVTIPRILP